VDEFEQLYKVENMTIQEIAERAGVDWWAINICAQTHGPSFGPLHGHHGSDYYKRQITRYFRKDY